MNYRISIISLLFRVSIPNPDFSFVCIFIHLSQKAIGRLTSSLRSCRPSVYHSGSQPVGHGNILRWATELFKKLLDFLKNSVTFVSLWLSLHFCVCLVVLTVVTMNDAAFSCYREIIFIPIIQLIVCSFVERL